MAIQYEKKSEMGSLIYKDQLLYFGTIPIDLTKLYSCKYERRVCYGDGTAIETETIILANGKTEHSECEKNAGPSWDDYSDYMETDDYRHLSFYCIPGPSYSDLDADLEVWDWVQEWIKKRNKAD